MAKPTITEPKIPSRIVRVALDSSGRFGRPAEEVEAVFFVVGGAIGGTTENKAEEP